jgi:hypothetical protein
LRFEHPGHHNLSGCSSDSHQIEQFCAEAEEIASKARGKIMANGEPVSLE